MFVPWVFHSRISPRQNRRAVATRLPQNENKPKLMTAALWCAAAISLRAYVSKNMVVKLVPTISILKVVGAAIAPPARPEGR